MKTKSQLLRTGLVFILLFFMGETFAQEVDAVAKPYAYRQIGNRYVISLSTDCELSAVLKAFVVEQGIRAGSITGSGMTREVVLSFYDPSLKDFKSKTFSEPMQLTDLNGSISTMDGDAYLQLNATLARSDFSMVAGLLSTAMIGESAEFIVEDFGKATLERSFDPQQGLNVYDFNKPSPGQPIRAYPDAFWTSEKKEEVFKSNTDWTIYYAGQDWIDFLVYQMVLVNKGYVYRGGTPDYISAYLDRMAVGEVPQSPVTLTLEKSGWMKQEITFYPEEGETPGGMKYTMKSRLYPGQDLLIGKKGPGVPPAVYEPYGKHRDWLKAKNRKEL